METMSVLRIRRVSVPTGSWKMLRSSPSNPGRFGRWPIFLYSYYIESYIHDTIVRTLDHFYDPLSTGLGAF